jgi:hypothetical protein
MVRFPAVPPALVRVVVAPVMDSDPVLVLPTAVAKFVVMPLPELLEIASVGPALELSPANVTVAVFVRAPRLPTVTIAPEPAGVPDVVRAPNAATSPLIVRAEAAFMEIVFPVPIDTSPL